MKTLKQLTDEIAERNSGLFNSGHFHEARIVLEPRKERDNCYIVRSESFYGHDLESARKANSTHREFLTCAGYNLQKTMRHPFNGEWSIYSGRGDDLARTEHEETANTIAYSFAKEIGQHLSEQFGFPFEDRTKNNSRQD